VHLHAVRERDEETAEMLLEPSEVNSDTAGKDNQAPLSLVGSSSREGFMMTLLDRISVSPGIEGQMDQTPLPWATTK